MSPSTAASPESAVSPVAALRAGGGAAAPSDGGPASAGPYLLLGFGLVLTSASAFGLARNARTRAALREREGPES
ncbi:hypothetical protein J2W21_003380 [Sinomonas atrocyanea]|uniref:hypothetical protein n=1 Tax=Sinomonas atrocyanea TaxID=37927 RepID=UPI0027844699|nr:hypothetical protein [Sinomonas atrocyanea]MDP9885855.1 hypothetical protein [Sinomonas atrocyanea]